MKIGLFGFPLTGKTTLFRLLTGAEPPAHHAAPGEVHLGMTRVPDPRLDRLCEIYHPRKTTPATVEYLDLAGMEKGQAAKVLPLEQLRGADALAHVVRAFEDEAVPHSEGDIDPARDVATMETEFILADHTVAEKRVEKLDLLLRKTHRDEEKRELELMRKVVAILEQEIPLRDLELDAEEARRLRGYTFLSRKPLLVVVNAGESDAARLADAAASWKLEPFAAKPRIEVIGLSAKIEGEIAQLDVEDARGFMADLGIEEPALNRMIRASYHLLGQISFFTVGEDDCHAWTIRRGTAARQAAGAVHSDMERGFIRAEVVSYETLAEAGGWSACREHGTLRLEGKEYVVQDGDVISFRFNV